MPNFNFKMHSFREIPMEFLALAPLRPALCPILRRGRGSLLQKPESLRHRPGSLLQKPGNLQCKPRSLFRKLRSLRHSPRSPLQKPRSLRYRPKFTSRSHYFEKAMKRKPRLRRVRSLHGKLCFYMILFCSGAARSLQHPKAPVCPEDPRRQPYRREQGNSLPYSTTGFFSVPIPSIMHSTTSPGLRNLGGSKPIPTPAGVPVAMMVPAFRVMPRLSSLTTSAIP